MNRKLFFFMMTALTLSACSSDSDPQAPSRSEIRLFTEVASQTRAVNNLTDLQNEQFVSGTKISVQITDNATSDPVNYLLTQYTANGSGGLTPDATQYFPASGGTVSVYAYHPTTATSNFSVQANQAGDDGTANYKASDLMWASLSAISNASTAEQCKLTFTHKLSKIVVQLEAGLGFTADQLASATIALGDATNKVIMNGTFTASTGEFSTATGDAITSGIITITTAAGTSEHAAIVVPQDMGGKKIAITIGDKTAYYPIAANTTFLTGKVYTYKLNVSMTGITLSSVSISNWNNGSEGGTGDPDADHSATETLVL